MTNVYVCWAKRTPIGRYGGALSSVRPDDMLATVLQSMMQNNQTIDWNDVDDIIIGCVNQSGEGNRNVARMSSLLAGLPETISATTINRLCASGMDAILYGSNAIKAGEADLIIAGGVESMSRAPFVLAKSTSAFDRNAEIYDTTMGWSFPNKAFQAQFGTDTMPVTAENVAEQFNIARQDQDAFALRSQHRYQEAKNKGFFDDEILPYSIPQRRGDDIVVNHDEHPRDGTNMEGLAKLPTPFKKDGTVTAGNASGINDGAAVVVLASEKAVQKYGLKPLAQVVTGATSGLMPRIMGMGPVESTKKALKKANLSLADMDVIELNEAFAAQALGCLRELGLPDDSPHVNANGGAIALGHPLGMSGTRLVVTAINQLHKTGGNYALCTMCVGVGQGIASIIKKVDA